MNTIWAFGDSFTFGHGCRSDGPLVEYYNEYKKDGDKIWVEWISEFMNTPVINCGICGCGNDMIFDTIIDNWDNIKSDDIVIIGMTFSGRFDVPIPTKNVLLPIFWNALDKGSMSNNGEYFNEDQRKTILNFQYYFAGNILYKNRQSKRFNFIKKLLKTKNVKCFIWEVEQFVKYNSFDIITTDTNNKIKDEHFSFKGHKEFADVLYKKLNNFTELI